MTQSKVTETFDRWAEDGRDDGMEKEHGDVVRQVVEKMGIAPGDKVLDLGCGNGWATRLLARTNAGVQAIGIDGSAKMIARADELHSFTIRARYDLGSFEALDFKDGEFQRIFSMEALYYSSDLEGALKEALRVLAPGGTADIVLDFYKESPTTASWAERMELDLHYLGEAEWRAAFERAGFANVTTERVIDSRGPGDEADYQSEDSCSKWDERVAEHEAGSLWIHAEKPA